MQKLIKILFVILLSNVISVYALDKDELFNSLRKEYSELKTIHILFSINDNSNQYGEIYAERGGKMQLSLKNNIIISDGKTIWNINPGSSVAISNYEDSKELTLENIFFDLMEELEPITYTKVTSTNSKDKYNLKLKPKENSNYKSRLKFLTLYFDSNSSLSRILIDSPSGVSEYAIDLLEKNPKINKSRFTYTPTKDVEVIDFR